MFIYQEKGGYCYNSDTLFLYDFISKFRPKGDVLDVGCGCGVLGLLIKENFKVNLTGIDIQKNNIFLSSINAKNNSLEAEFVCDDFLGYKFEKKFDFIVSNPPFYKAENKQSENLSKKISRFNDSLPLYEFIKKCNILLKPRGELLLCYDGAEADMVFTLLKNCKIKINEIRWLHPKPNKNATIVMIRAKKSSKSMLKCLPPLITHIDGEFSDEVKSIYKKIGLKSLKCELEPFGLGDKGIR